MADLSVLQDILILLGLALVNAYFFSLLRQSPIVGYLATGFLVGPYGFHLIKGIHEVELVAEVGVILLLFTIGLEFSYGRIIRLKDLMLKAGSTQIAITFILIFIGTFLLGETVTTAICLGMALCLSSTAIVLKLLLERGEVDSAYGRLCLAILLFQDLGVIIFLIALPLLGNEAHTFSPFTFFRAGALMLGLFILSRYLLQPFLRIILKTRSPELFRLTILSLVLGTAWVTAQAGLSLALGAFVAGLALAESDSSHQVIADIIPFRDVFLAVFFISIGMLVDLNLLIQNWQNVLIGLVCLSLVKTLAGTMAGFAIRYPLRLSLTAGLAIFQGGEFSFILLKQASDLKIVPDDTYQLILSVITLSMLLTPLMFTQLHTVAATLTGWFGRPLVHMTSDDEERTGNLEGHVIICGYGVAGRNVAQTLRDLQLPYIHIEMNGEAVRTAKMAGEVIIHGDATVPAVLEGAGIQRAKALVLAINDLVAQIRLIKAARELSPDLFILARTQFLASADHLLKTGADDVITDDFGAGLELSAFLLQHFHVPDGQALKVLSKLREEHQQRYGQNNKKTRSLSGYLSVLEGGEIEFQAVPDDSLCLGKSLAELDFRKETGCTVVGIVRNERVNYSPPAEQQLEKGDTLMLLGDQECIQKAREFLHGHPV